MFRLFLARRLITRRLITRRKFASKSPTETGESSIRETIRTDASGQTTRIMEQITNIRRTWSQMNPWLRRTVYGYVIGATTNNLYATYHQGKEALLDHRESPTATDSSTSATTQAKNEWRAVAQGCRRGSFNRFVDSLFWPVTLVGYAMPTMVLWLNSPTQIPKKMDDLPPPAQ